MFYDETYASTIDIDSSIIQFDKGGFYSNEHAITSSINIQNVSIQTNQLNTDITKGIFVFTSMDVVNMTEIAVLYIYNVSAECEYDEVIYNSIINANCTVFLCKNPMIFVNNNGQISIDNIMLDTDIDYGNIKQQYHTKYHYFKYEDDGQYGWITNKGIINIGNADIRNTICYALIWNEYQLSMNDITVTQYTTDIYNRNDLHSRRIIYQSGIAPSLYLDKGYFVGSYFGVYLSSASATIINCSFQQMAQAIRLRYHILHYLDLIQMD